MAPYDEWNTIEEEEEEELQDASYLEARKDVILFCIDCSESMQELYEDSNYEDVQTSHLFTALEAAVQIQKRKIIVGPNDSVGILLYNTTRQSEFRQGQGAELNQGTFLYEPISPLSAPKVQQLIQLLDAAREDPNELRNAFPPTKGQRVPLGNVFTSCNWVLRDGAPRTATKRVFLITDEDDPHPGKMSKQLVTSARTTLIDLTQAGVAVEPFFISTESKPFNVSKFYGSVLLPNSLADEESSDSDPSVLPESISIARIEDLLSQMRFHEVPKRAQCSMLFHLAEGLTIGVKGYSLVTEQKKGTYKYFVDLGDRMEVANSATLYVDEDRQAEVEKTKMLYGPDLGAPPTTNGDEDENDVIGGRKVKLGRRPFYTVEEIRTFRTLGLEPGIKLLGFKDRSELTFEDNVKHSMFIYPDELEYSGSKRTFSALLNSMVKKEKIGLALVLSRRNATPVFCALLPQQEKKDEDEDWSEPSGFHLIQLPFADDIRAAAVEKGFRASDDLKDAARAWIDKLSVKNGTYPPDSYPNPALAFYNAQLQATAFREEFDPDSFEDLTKPKHEMIRKRAGTLVKSWKTELGNDPSVTLVVPTVGSKRKAESANVDESEIRAKYESGTLAKLRVDQLKDFLKAKSLQVTGKKADLIDRVSEWCNAH